MNVLSVLPEKVKLFFIHFLFISSFFGYINSTEQVLIMFLNNKTYTLEREQTISLPRSVVFEFFSNAHNLELLTPSFLNFRILNEGPIDIQEGTIIDYKLRLFGVPFRWKTRIERFLSNQAFVDTQVNGPYALWHHTHTFEDHGHGTVMRDIVLYRMPLGILGSIAHLLFVRRTLETIFQFRHDALSRHLEVAS